MKVYKYQAKIYNSVLDFEHRHRQMQERLYIPGRGLIGYRKEIDFFTDDREALEKAQLIEGKDEIELPDEVVLQVVATGKTLNIAKEAFQKAAKALVEEIK